MCVQNTFVQIKFHVKVIEGTKEEEEKEEKSKKFFKNDTFHLFQAELNKTIILTQCRKINLVNFAIAMEFLSLKEKGKREDGGGGGDGSCSLLVAFLIEKHKQHLIRF